MLTWTQNLDGSWTAGQYTIRYTGVKNEPPYTVYRIGDSYIGKFWTTDEAKAHAERLKH